MIDDLIDILSGGDLRSDGRADEAAERVKADIKAGVVGSDQPEPVAPDE